MLVTAGQYDGLLCQHLEDKQGSPSHISSSVHLRLDNDHLRCSGFFLDQAHAQQLQDFGRQSLSESMFDCMDLQSSPSSKLLQQAPPVCQGRPVSPLDTTS